VEGSDRLRLFCVLDHVTELQQTVWQPRELGGGDGRIVPRANLHVTLAFLGSQAAGDLAAIAAALGSACGSAERPRLHLRGYRETRSVGMLMLDDAEGAAAALAVDLHARLERLGVYEPERRPWLPHVTVVRFRERPRLRPRIPELGQVVPSGAAVYHSVLRPTGAQYVALQEFGVGGGPEVKERTERVS
jgi:2'-5' RNA ligase